MKKYSVSLVYVKQEDKEVKVMLRCLITNALMKNDALWNTIQEFESETKGFELICKTIIRIK